MTTEEEDIREDRKNKNKKKKRKKSNRVGKIVSKQISWTLVVVLSKVCLEYDLFEFINFAC